MNELKQVNPYETPQSPSSRRRFNFLIYGSIIAVVLIGAAASIFMIATSVKTIPEKPNNRVYMTRGPMPDREVESPSQSK